MRDDPNLISDREGDQRGDDPKRSAHPRARTKMQALRAQIILRGLCYFDRDQM